MPGRGEGHLGRACLASPMDSCASRCRMLPILVLANEVCEADTKPLLMLLQRNDPAKDTPFRTGQALFPLCSSEQTSMVLAFFGYKMPRLKLVQVNHAG